MTRVERAKYDDCDFGRPQHALRRSPGPRRALYRRAGLLRGACASPSQNQEPRDDARGPYDTFFFSSPFHPSYVTMTSLGSTSIGISYRSAPQATSFFSFFFSFYPPADGKKKSLSSPLFHVFSHASCVDLTPVAFATQR